MMSPHIVGGRAMQSVVFLPPLSSISCKSLMNICRGRSLASFWATGQGVGVVTCHGRPIYWGGMQKNHSSCRLSLGDPTVNQRPIFTAWSTDLDSEEIVDDSTCVCSILTIDSLDSVGHRSSTIAPSNFCVFVSSYAGNSKTSSLRARAVYVVPSQYNVQDTLKS